MTIDWSTWKPGDTDAEFIASTPGWLAEGLKNQKISFPGADKVQLDDVAKQYMDLLDCSRVFAQ